VRVFTNFALTFWAMIVFNTIYYLFYNILDGNPLTVITIIMGIISILSTFGKTVPGTIVLAPKFFIRF
jgi:hypothetical protein